MKKKKFLSVLVAALMIFSPVFLLSKKACAADDDEVYTVILKSGKGTGSDIIIKSTDPGAMANSESNATDKQFFTENNATYFCTPLSKPSSFAPPTDKQYSFCGWVTENGEYLHDEDVKMNNYENNTLVLTALWNDSYFEVEVPDAIEINGPGYNDFTYILKNLHLGKTDLGNGNELIVDSVELEFTKGTLESNGKVIPYSVCPTYGNPGKRAISESFTEADIGKEFAMSIYISPEDYDNAQNGTYGGKLNCSGIYTCHPYSAENPDASSPNYIFETKKFRGVGVSTLPLIFTIFHESITPSYSEGNLTTEEINDEEASFPKTGDSINTIQLIALAAVSVFGLTIAMITINKKRKSQY